MQVPAPNRPRSGSISSASGPAHHQTSGEDGVRGSRIALRALRGGGCRAGPPPVMPAASRGGAVDSVCEAQPHKHKSCSKCGKSLDRSAFSGQQWFKGTKATRKCSACVDGATSSTVAAGHGATHGVHSLQVSTGTCLQDDDVRKRLKEVRGRGPVREEVEEAVGNLWAMVMIDDLEQAREAGRYGLKGVKSALAKMDVLINAPPSVPRIAKPATTDNGAESDVRIVEEIGEEKCAGPTHREGKCDTQLGVRITPRHTEHTTRRGSRGWARGKKGLHGVTKKKAESDDKNDAKAIANKCKRLQIAARARSALQLRLDCAASAKDQALMATLIRARRYGGPR